MNRAEKRRLAKEGLKGIKEETKTVGDFIHLYTLSFMLALDSCEVGKGKALEIMAKVEENASCMLSGHINQKDVEIMCKEEYGIDFVDYVRKHTTFVNRDGTLVTE